jgi:uncharacterized protein YukE
MGRASFGREDPCGDDRRPLAGGTGGFTGPPPANTIEEDQSRRRIAEPAIVAANGRPGRVACHRPLHVPESRPDMAQAIVNPEELRRFAARLKQFNNEMMTQLTTLHGQLSGLGQSWRDREHDKFVEEFEQTLQVVKRFVDATNQHIPFLLRKAERIEEYLQQR